MQKINFNLKAGPYRVIPLNQQESVTREKIRQMILLEREEVINAGWMNTHNRVDVFVDEY
jgi:hypothetical protein